MANWFEKLLHSRSYRDDVTCFK
uniref:Uncharacterized protein n=1 Tax=Anguilla anguilla TaxID=7936 RepID=A0A0E9RYM3_ANGAN